MTDPLRDVRIGTMVKANLADPAAYVRSILQHGFESIQPYFWQTMGDKDIPRLAAEIRDAIGDDDVKVSALGMFGNPLEDQEFDRETLKGWQTLIDNAHLFGTDIVTGFTGRIRGKPLPDSLPRYKQVLGELAKRAADKGVRIAFENCAMDGNWAHRRLEHRPQSRRLGDDVRRAARRQSRPRMGAVPSDGQSDRPDPAAAQMGAQDLPRARQGRDGSLGRDPRARHLRQGAVRPIARPALATATGRGSSSSCAWPASRARSTSKAGTIRSIATNSR